MRTWAGSSFRTGRRPWALLQSEASLNEIVQLVGKDSLSPADQLTLESARMVREDFLQQNSFVDVDSFSTYDRQEKLLAMILDYDRLCRGAIEKGGRGGGPVRHPQPGAHRPGQVHPRGGIRPGLCRHCPGHGAGDRGRDGKGR